ncbi:hypothetical protein ACSQ67_001801 [Phaseolus vulgaris]
METQLGERKKTMAEDPIFSFCNGLAAFCNHLHSSSDALKQSIDRRPIPLVPDIEEEEEEDEAEDTQHQDPEDKLDSPSSFYGSLSVADHSFKSFEEDALLDESLSLKKFGLSDAYLATLASEGDLASHEPEKLQEFRQQNQPVAHIMVASEGSRVLPIQNDNLKSAEVPSPRLQILKSEFECLPAYMKGLASWEDLLGAVDKINSSLSKKTNGCSYFHQDEIPSFELGPKTRSYLLLFVRMNRLVVETIDGILSYRVL